MKTGPGSRHQEIGAYLESARKESPGVHFPKVPKIILGRNFLGLFSGAILGFQNGFFTGPDFLLIFSGIFSRFVVRILARA